MTQNERPVGHVQVKVFIAVHVPDSGALASGGDERKMVGQHAHRAAVPARDRLSAALEDLLAEWRGKTDAAV